MAGRAGAQIPEVPRPTCVNEPGAPCRGGGRTPESDDERKARWAAIAEARREAKAERDAEKANRKAEKDAQKLKDEQDKQKKQDEARQKTEEERQAAYAEQQRQLNAQREREAEAERQRQLAIEAQRLQAAFDTIKPNVVSALKGVDDDSADTSGADDGVVYLGDRKMPAILRSSAAVTEAEWAEARLWQSRIAHLYAKGMFTAVDARELSELEAKRNALWKRAISVEGLTQRDRDALRLNLHRIDDGAVEASAEDLILLRERSPVPAGKGYLSILSGMPESSITYGLTTQIETVGEDVANGLAEVKTVGENIENIRAEIETVGEDNANRLAEIDAVGKDIIAYRRAEIGAKVLKFGDAYFISGAALAFANGKPEEAGGPTVAWLFGKLVSEVPSASLGVATVQGVAAVTVATFQKSLDNLLEETDKILPGFLPEGGATAWREDMKANSTRAQKFCYEAWGF